MRRAAAVWGLWAATAAGPVRATVLNDTGFLKSGSHSVGVKRQYTGSAGKITHCQVGVSLAVATDDDTVPLDMALDLPREWTVDEPWRAAAKIPADVAYAPKWQLARQMRRDAHADGVPLGDVVLADADDGRVMAFRTAVTDLGLHDGVGVPSTQQVYLNDRVQTARQVAAAIREARWKRITWREGDGAARLSGRLAFRRVRVGEEYGVAHADGPAPWLVLEWRDGEAEPGHFYLSSRPRAWNHGALVAEIKGRWRGERLYEDLKGELGLDHYEGRGWIGWHHHISVVFCCDALLVAERLVAFPPSALAALRARYDRRAA